MITANSQLNINAIKSHYQEDSRTVIHDMLSPDSAQSLANALNVSSAFDYAYVKDGKPTLMSPDETAAMSREDQHKMRTEIVRQGSQGAGYLFGRHVIDNQSELLLKQANEWLNSEATLNLVKSISGKSDISHASAQATKYMPGHFLTRHQDTHEREKRRLTFILNLTPNWHPDWGGLLQFYQQDGTPRDAWAPVYNSMALFDVQHIQSVTYVAPLAAAPRLSISGWFRAA